MIFGSPEPASGPRRRAAQQCAARHRSAAFSFSPIIPTRSGRKEPARCWTASPTKSATPGPPAQRRAPGGSSARPHRGEACAQRRGRDPRSAGRGTIRRGSSAGGPGCEAPWHRRPPPASMGATKSPRPRNTTRAGRSAFPPHHLEPKGRHGRTAVGPAGREAPGSRCKRDHRDRGRSASAGSHRTQENWNDAGRGCL